MFSISSSGEDWQSKCRQLVVVVTDDWSSTTGTLWVLEKRGTEWQAVGEPFPVSVGRKGLGWGIGLHPADLDGPIKKEGDKRAPAGVYRLEFGFGTKAMLIKNFDYRKTTATDIWVDDPKSSFYNRWVDTEDKSVASDWDSAEKLRRPDGIYDYAIVVGHNRNPIFPGRGSAIFLHAWFGEEIPTIGCTAMEKTKVKEILAWLDRSKYPVIVQAPSTELGLLALPFDPDLIQTSR